MTGSGSSGRFDVSRAIDTAAMFTAAPLAADAEARCDLSPVAEQPPWRGFLNDRFWPKAAISFVDLMVV